MVAFHSNRAGTGGHTLPAATDLFHHGADHLHCRIGDITAPARDHRSRSVLNGTTAGGKFMSELRLSSDLDSSKKKELLLPVQEVSLNSLCFPWTVEMRMFSFTLPAA